MKKLLNPVSLIWFNVIVIVVGVLATSFSAFEALIPEALRPAAVALLGAVNAGLLYARSQFGEPKITTKRKPRAKKETTNA